MRTQRVVGQLSGTEGALELRETTYLEREAEIGLLGGTEHVRAGALRAASELRERRIVDLAYASQVRPPRPADLARPADGAEDQHQAPARVGAGQLGYLRVLEPFAGPRMTAQEAVVGARAPVLGLERGVRRVQQQARDGALCSAEPAVVPSDFLAAATAATASARKSRRRRPGPAAFDDARPRRSSYAVARSISGGSARYAGVCVGASIGSARRRRIRDVDARIRKRRERDERGERLVHGGEALLTQLVAHDER